MDETTSVATVLPVTANFARRKILGTLNFKLLPAPFRIQLYHFILTHIHVYIQKDCVLTSVYKNVYCTVILNE